jgi:hypothetical protein
MKSGVIFTGRNWSAVRPSTRKNESPFKVLLWDPQEFGALSVTTTHPTVNNREKQLVRESA